MDNKHMVFGLAIGLFIFSILCISYGLTNL